MSEREHSIESVRAQVAEWHERMAELRAAAEVDVLANWSSPWKTDATVKVKVDARLASNKEFREITVKAREASAAWGLDP